ncbi:putative hydro-lyase [Glycomyces sp. L485]|uniref:putative hydro-lyase n=1 Tax=Glycomyces sp. L485 TaxID=2909235 RepID=UPI001F4AC48E|nr:putative hydro-lyase [Glycomyces sp. L485]MCH7231147.1 putative hydro-lyase [Glycomyces sp. L485]
MFTRQRPEAMVLPADARARFRGGLVAPTSGWSKGYVQANLVSVPRRHAVALRRFAVRNPRACPLLEIVGPGRFTTSLAEGVDLRRDLPAYLVWRNGSLVDWRTDATSVWGDDLVTLLIGCSFTFEPLLESEGIPLRHLEQGSNVPMYRTGLPCLSAGRFRSRIVVSMRPMPPHLVARAAMVTARMPYAHGLPVHVGGPAALGIRDLGRPDFGDPVDPAPGDVPVFWACGVTLQEAVVAAKLPFAITHAPGHMLITDRRARPAGVGGGFAKVRPKVKRNVI